MKPDSPMYPALIQSIVENMNLSNRDELLETLQQASQPDPQAQQMAMAQQQAQLEFQQSQTMVLQSQAAESNARANKYTVEAQNIPLELEIKKIDAITDSLQKGDEDDKEFERRLRIAEIALKERELNDRSEVAKATSQKREALITDIMGAGGNGRTGVTSPNPQGAEGRPRGPTGAGAARPPRA